MTDSPEFIADQEVYATDGRVALYIAPYGDTHIVAPIHDHDDETGEPLMGGPVAWDQIFATPPVARVEASVAALQARAEALRSEVEELRREKREAEQSRKSTLSKLAQHRALARIDDFLEGRYPPLVLIVGEWRAPVLMTREEAVKDTDRYSRETKLMVLFGKSGGDVEWRINQYNDGSGFWSTVYPVQDEAEAKAVVRDLFDGHVKKWREDGRKSHGIAMTWANELPAGWVVVPDDVVVAIRESVLSVLRTAEAKMAADLSATQSKIAAIEGGV